MIRVNQMIAKARSRRGLWILLLILLVILLALVALHTFGDASTSDGPLVCMAIVLLVALAVVIPTPVAVAWPSAPTGRGPPVRVLRARAARSTGVLQALTPLRL